MADVRINLEVDTKEAEAKLRVLEARASRLNVATVGGSGLPSQRALTSGSVVTGLPSAERPGQQFVPNRRQLEPSKQTAHSNALSLGAATAAGLAAGGIRGAGPATGRVILDKSTFESMRATKDSVLLRGGNYNDIRLRAMDHRAGSLVSRMYLGGLPDLGSGATLREVLGQARQRYGLNWTIERRESRHRRLMQFIDQPRRMRPFLLRGKPNPILKYSGLSAAGGYIKSGVREGAVKTAQGFAAVANMPIGPIIGIIGATEIASQAYQAIKYTVSDDLREAIIGNTAEARQRIGEDIGVRTFDRFAQQMVQKNAEIFQSISAGIMTINSGIQYAFGEYDRAKNSLELADLLSGRFKERHERLSLLQDAWIRGFDNATDAAAQFSRDQSTASAMRAVQIGIRGGDMLDLDKRIYFEIVDQAKQRYQKEYRDKVPYPTMDDIDGAK